MDSILIIILVIIFVFFLLQSKKSHRNVNRSTRRIKDRIKHREDR